MPDRWQATYALAYQTAKDEAAAILDNYPDTTPEALVDWVFRCLPGRIPEGIRRAAAERASARVLAVREA